CEVEAKKTVGVRVHIFLFRNQSFEIGIHMINGGVLAFQSMSDSHHGGDVSCKINPHLIGCFYEFIKYLKLQTGMNLQEVIALSLILTHFFTRSCGVRNGASADGGAGSIESWTQCLLALYLLS